MSAPLLTAADEHALVRQIHDRIAGAHTNDKATRYHVTIPNTTVAYDMMPIPAGEFTMGSTKNADEKPTHKVRLDAFWMQAHEVTWDEYRLFMFESQAGETAHKDQVVDAVSRPTRPYVEMSFGMGINGYPAISMTQHAANKYAEWLSAKTGEFYRLPTEAEWEYACRANASNDPSPLGDYAWYEANSKGKYQLVETKKPNAWGLYDMLGNVMEWTLDAYAPYKPDAQVNPWVKATAPYPHAVRGGSWNDPAAKVTCTARVASDPSWKQQDPQLPKSIWYMTDAQWLGFRLVRPATVPSAQEMYNYWNSGVEEDASARPFFQAVEPHMGTLVSIKLYAANERQAKAAFRAAFDRIAQLDDALSDYKPSSELNRIARTAVDAPVKISRDLFDVLAMSQQLGDESGGAFDVTVGPVVGLWREARKDRQLPDPDMLDAALSHCGYRKMHLDRAARTIRLDEDGMQLDLGAIAKGYAADQALDVLKHMGIRSALVAASGDLAFSDAPPGSHGWKILIDASDRVLELANAAVSTSGDSEQHLDANGKRYSHIVDPITGIALTNGLTVTVVAPRGILADPLATAISVLGERRGRQLASRHAGVSVFVRQRDSRASKSIRAGLTRAGFPALQK